MGLRERQREHTAQVILECAADLFGRQGYHGTSMEDVARAVGCATATLYGYFRSKEELFTRLLGERMNAYLDGVTRCVASTATFWEGIDAYLGHFVAFAEEHKDFLKVMIMVMRAPQTGAHPDLEAADAFNAAYLGQLCTLVQRGIDEGLVAGSNPVTLAVNLTGMVHANSFAWLLDPDHYDLALGLATTRAMLTGGVGEPPR